MICRNLLDSLVFSVLKYSQVRRGSCLSANRNESYGRMNFVLTIQQLYSRVRYMDNSLNSQKNKLGFCLRQGIISCSQPFPVPRRKQCQALTQAYFPPRQLEGFAIIILQKHSRKEPKRLQTTNRCKPILTLSSDFLKIQVHILFYNSIKTLSTRKARVRVFKIGGFLKENRKKKNIIKTKKQLEAKDEPNTA